MALAGMLTTTILPITDPGRARAFYEERLGLPYLGDDAEGKPLFALAGGATLALIEKPAGAQGEHTALSFEVADIEGTIETLQGAGVQFEDYDLPGLRTVNHVCVLGAERAAWFTDPDGNILCLHQQS